MNNRVTPYLFKDAFIAAFQMNKQSLIWTDDRVLKTSVMQSYIYHAIAKSLNMYLICELEHLDATFFYEEVVQHCIKTGIGYPEPKYIQVALEHEINATSSHNEMTKLVKLNCPLNVLITYREYDQYSWLTKKFSSNLSTLNGDAGEFLVILPRQEPSVELSQRWNYFVWDKQQNSFTAM